MIPKVAISNGKKVDTKEDLKKQVSNVDLTDNNSDKNSDYLLSNIQIRDYIDEIMKKDENEQV